MNYNFTFNLKSGVLILMIVLSGTLSSFVYSQNYQYCNSTTSLTSSSGSFDDGSGNNNYANNSDCKWVIQPTGATSVTLSFNSIDLIGNDILKVYDGNSTNSNLIGSYDGLTNTLPSSLTSSGGDMLLHFISNSSYNDLGWSVSYTSVTGSIACSGTTVLTSQNGTFDDGSGNTNYANNSNCKWVIQPTGATSITLNFNSLDIVGNDMLKVYDGNSTSSNLIGSYDGSTNTLPSSLSSNGGVMLIHFTSNSSYNDFGWNLSYNSTISNANSFCNTLSILNDTADTFSDGSGNLDYALNSDCKWLIDVPGATSISLVFTSFDIENNYDFVKVYDGNSMNATLLASLTGNTAPSTITSTGSQLLVHFTSDNMINKPGWNALYTSVMPPANYCSGMSLLTDTAGIFSDGSGAQNYAADSDCKWLIDVNGATSISLDFSSFDLENNYDFIKVYDGNSVNSTLLSTFTGNTIPSTVSSTGSKMLVYFTSDNLVNKGGWDASYYSVIPSNTGNNYCSGMTLLTDTVGVFSDGSGAQKYDNNSDCKWLIDVNGATSISLDFSSFDIENNYDFIKVYDGNSVNSTLLTSLTGNTIPSTVSSTGSKMLVHFTSDNLVNKAGWDASYTSVIPSNTGNNFCSGLTLLTDTVGVFSDGSGSQKYDNNSDCKWLIDVNGATSISLDFSSFDVENNYDYVKVYDGNTVSSSLLVSLTGSSMPSVVTSSGSQMLVHFTSDNMVNKAGWDASYTSTMPVVVPDVYCSGTSTFSDTIGIFSDGSGAQDYEIDSDCKWLIDVNGATSIELSFTSFDVENNYDFVKVYDGNNINAPLLAILTGNTIPSMVSSTGSKMLVHFTSDNIVNKAGWDAFYTSVMPSVGSTLAPVADFMASAISVEVGDTVSFIDISQNNPTSWDWIFVNASILKSSLQNPTGISYDTPGCFDVHLTAHNNQGSDQENKSCYIDVKAKVGLGIGNSWVEKGLKVYPNPNDGKFNLYFNLEEEKETFVSITNMLGQEVYNIKVSGKAEFDEEIDLRKSKKGLYFINVQSGDHMISKRIVLE